MDITLRNYSPNSENREKWSGSVKVELEKTKLIIVDFTNYEIFNIKITYQSYLRKYQLHRKHTLNVEYSTKLEFI